MKSFLLMIGDNGALLMPPDQNTQASLFVAGHDDKQAKPILEALALRPRVPILILADTLAQEFRRDELPRLNFLDKRKLLARRLKQHFPHTQLTAALTLKNNAALLAGLHDGGPVDVWLERLAPLSNPSGSVALLPLESAGMVTALLPQARQGWGLLLSQQRTGGIRQIVTHNGALIFTRLTPPLPHETSPSYAAANLALDLQASRDYLARLGLTGGTPLHMIAVLPESLHAAVAAAQLPVENLSTLTPHQTAKRLGLPFAPAPEDPTSDLLYAAWLKRRHPRTVLMHPETRRAHNTNHIKRWGTRAALAAWLFALTLIGWQGHDLVQLGIANRNAAREIGALRNQLEQERTTLAPVTEPLGRLRQALERKRLFADPASVPWPLLLALGQTLDGKDRIAQLDWQNETGKAQDEALQINLHFADANTPEQKQEIFQHFDQLQQLLRTALPDYDVKIVRYPFPVLPDEPLSNSTDNNQAAPLRDGTLAFRRVTP
jgi:hypothetical protein